MSKPLTKSLLSATLDYLNSISKDKNAAGEEMKELKKPVLCFWAKITLRNDGAQRATDLYNTLLEKLTDDSITDYDVLSYMMKIIDPTNRKPFPDGLGTSTTLRYNLLNALCRRYNINAWQIESNFTLKYTRSREEIYMPAIPSLTDWINSQFELVSKHVPQEMEMRNIDKAEHVAFAYY